MGHTRTDSGTKEANKQDQVIQEQGKQDRTGQTRIRTMAQRKYMRTSAF